MGNFFLMDGKIWLFLSEILQDDSAQPEQSYRQNKNPGQDIRPPKKYADYMLLHTFPFNAAVYLPANCTSRNAVFTNSQRPS